jgi:hypothetical protein
VKIFNVNTPFCSFFCEKNLFFTKRLESPVSKFYSDYFIYIQMFYCFIFCQPGVSTLWSNVVCSDVTSEYAGLFFRAQVGESDFLEKFRAKIVGQFTALF